MEQEIQKVPKVFILGVQRSGKTVFLSVLGTKFMLLAQGNEAAPLGFRLVPQSDKTVELVRKKYAELKNGRWVASTSEDDMTRLHWTVYTGDRPIFDLATMDCSGEQIRKAFAVDAEGFGTPSEPSDSDTVTDALLSANGTGSGSGEFRVEEIRAAVKEASLVCLFVNAAEYPSGGAGAALQKNFEDTVNTFWRLLKKDTELAGKSLLVLTQTHLVRETIESVGGPSLYLCERGAQHLQQEVERYKIPIICVSAVNETSSENMVPDTIESDGLFGFLLTVGGIVAGKKDKLFALKNRYLEYLWHRNEFARQLAIRAILPSRFPVLKEFVVAAEAFRNGCFEYVCDPANMNQHRIENLYRIATEQDGDVESAGNKWRDRLRVDEIWMRRMLKLVGRRTSVQFRDTDGPVLIDAVKREANVMFDPLLYGYDTNIGSGIDYEEWVRQSVEVMPIARSGDWAALENMVKTIRTGINQLRGAVGKDGFEQSANELAEQCKELEKLIDRFCIVWQDYGDGLDWKKWRLSGFENERRKILDECYGLMNCNEKALQVREVILSKLKSVRSQMEQGQFSEAKKALRELERMAVRDPFSKKHPDEISMREIGQVKDELTAANRARRQQRFRTFRRRLVTLLVLAVIGCGGYYGAKWYCENENRQIAEEIARYLKNPETNRMSGVYGAKKAKAAADAADAKSGDPKFRDEEIEMMLRDLERVYDCDWDALREKAQMVRNYPWLGITPTPYIREDFLERVGDYSSRERLDKIREVLKRADDYCAAFAEAPDKVQSALIADRDGLLEMCRQLSRYAKIPTFEQLNSPDFQFSESDKDCEAVALGIRLAMNRLKRAKIEARQGNGK